MLVNTRNVMLWNAALRISSVNLLDMIVLMLGVGDLTSFEFVLGLSSMSSQGHALVFRPKGNLDVWYLIAQLTWSKVCTRKSTLQGLEHIVFDVDRRLDSGGVGKCCKSEGCFVA